MRKSQYLIFIICTILLCIGGWYFLNQESMKGDSASITFTDTEKIKLNEKVDPISLIKSTNSTNILYPTIDTSTPGKKTLLYIAINDKGMQKEFAKEIWVVDPTPPVLRLKQDKAEIYINDKFDPQSYVKEATSNYDGKLAVKIDGDFKTDKAGTYPLRYIVKDSSNHTVSKTLILIVKEKAVKKDPQKTEERPVQEPSKKPTQERPIAEHGDKESPKAPQTGQVSGGQTWMFANGESFSSALGKCNSAGVASGRGYQCNVLQDANGIYTGYRLDLQ